MYLTEQEHEAFMRGRAAGLIPEDYPLPSCDKEIDELICHIGIMFSRRIACRNHQRKLRLITLSAFTEEHLRAFTIRLPEVRREEISAVTGLQQELFLNPLEALYHYFTSGREIVSAEDLAGRLAVDVKPIPLQNILNVLRTLLIPYSLIALSNTALFPRVIEQSSMMQFSIERTEPPALLVRVFMVELYLSNSDTRKFNCIAVLVLMF